MNLEDPSRTWLAAAARLGLGFSLAAILGAAAFGCGGKSITTTPPKASSSASSDGKPSSDSAAPQVATTAEGGRTDLPAANADGDGASADAESLFPKGADGLESEVADPNLPADPVIP